MALPSTGYDLATISNPSSALTDFTLIVDLSRMSSSWWADVNTSDGTRGRAAKSDGTELACDWIDFDNSGETGLLRVKWSGTLASSGTQQLRIYPPNTRNDAVAADGTYGADNAYDSYWELYFPSGGGSDRTSNGRDGTANGGVSVGGAIGQIGKATNFDGIDDNVVASYTPAASTNHTWLIWTNADTVRQQWMLCNNVDTGALWGFGSYDANGVLRAYSGGAGTRWIGNNGDCTANWEQFAVIYNSSSGISSVIKNASALSSTLNNSTTPITDATEFRVAGRLGWNYFDGLLNEAQVHSTARSADWISHEYDQTSDNATFWGSWSWQSSGGSSSVPAIINHLRNQGVI